MKKIVVIALLAAVVLGGILLYARRNSAGHLLASAQDALSGERYDKAREAAAKYVLKCPKDYRGWWLLGQADLRLGRYSQARDALLKADELHPGDMTMVLTLAKAYSLPAGEQMAAAQKVSDRTAMLRSAVEGYAQAEVALGRAKPLRLEENMTVQTALGENCANLSRAWQALADRLGGEALLAETGGDARIGDERRDQQQPALASARQAAKRASTILLGVMKDARDMRAAPGVGDVADDCFSDAAVDLVQLACQRNDNVMLSQAAAALAGAEDKAPRAAALLTIRQVRQEECPEPEQVAAAADSLDKLMKIKLPAKSLDDADVKLARAEVALLSGDLAMAQDLCRNVLSGLPRYLPAKLLEARVLIAQSNYSQAERNLFVLKGDMPESLEAKLAYAQAAHWAGKKDLARNEMHAVTCLDPGNAVARKYLADVLMADGFFESAFEQASAYYRAHPDDPQAIKLFVETARKTGREELANKVQPPTVE